MVLDHVYNGIWGIVAPESYYRALPGAEVSGARDALNVVLIRDMSAGRLTLAALLLAAAISMDRRVVRVAMGAATVSGVIRLLDHVVGSTGDGWPNWVGYSLAVVLPIALWRMSRSLRRDA